VNPLLLQRIAITQVRLLRLDVYRITRLLCLVFLLVALSSPTVLASEMLEPGSVVTLAGTTEAGFNGDFLPDGAPRLAETSELNLPWGVAIGPSGRYLYVADSGNHRIRRIDRRSGTIFTVAGNGSPDYRGDGGIAANASLQAPAGIAIDRDGDLYIADMGNHRVRRVDVAGNITTVAGGNRPGFYGDYGVATQAALRSPVDIAIDSVGNLFISDSGNHRVRMVDPDGIITTVAGSGAREFDGDSKRGRASAMTPSGIALDGAGGLLVADAGNHRIRRVDLLTGITTTLAGRANGFGGDGGLALGARLNSPSGIAVSRSGDVFIADSGNRRIRMISAATGVIETVAGSGRASVDGEEGAAVEASLWNPYGIALDASDNLFVADYLNHRLRRVNLRKSRVVGFVSPTEPVPSSSAGWRLQVGLLGIWPGAQGLGRVFSKDSDAEIISEPGVGIELVIRRKPETLVPNLPGAIGPGRPAREISGRGISDPELAWLILWPKSRPTSDTIAAGHDGFIMALFLGAKRPVGDVFLTGAVGFWFIKFSRNRYEDALDLNPGFRFGVGKQVGTYRDGDLLARLEYMPLKGPTYLLNTAVVSLRYLR
jgi:DNA-binding beta-propeller fold protein YncE